MSRARRLDADWAVIPAEHTVHGPTYDVVEWWPETGGTGAIVARLHPSVRGVEGREVALPVVFKRALVMAASRELLAALEMVRDADEDCKKDGLPRWCTDVARATIDKAIAKARNG